MFEPIGTSFFGLPAARLRAPAAPEEAACLTGRSNSLPRSGRTCRDCLPRGSRKRPVRRCVPSTGPSCSSTSRGSPRCRSGWPATGRSARRRWPTSSGRCSPGSSRSRTGRAAASSSSAATPSCCCSPGSDHPVRGARAALGMRKALREIGAIETTAGKVTLRMSVGLHSGVFDFFLVGDSHRELLITGPAATETVSMEGTAVAGEVLASRATAALLPECGPRQTEGRWRVAPEHAQGLPRETSSERGLARRGGSPDVHPGRASRAPARGCDGSGAPAGDGRLHPFRRHRRPDPARTDQRRWPSAWTSWCRSAQSGIREARGHVPRHGRG